MIEVTLETIQISLVSSHRIVVLKELESDRYLPIWIGPCEAEAISVGAKGIEVLRPLTHDLIVNILDAFEADLLYIHVNDLADNTFYATLVLSAAGGEIEIDVRPSDAIAIAVRTGVPIYVSEAVMDKAGVMPEKDILENAPDGENLDVFRDFLSSLDFDESRDS
ncbi:MAG: bifunctional nuclease family protein [Anaerolineae bacterium]